MTSEDHDTQLVTEAARKLGEDFDAVQIFASRHEPTTEGGTISVHAGVGNGYARYGQVRQWIVKEDELARKNVDDD